jgi:hypothetical protein
MEAATAAAGMVVEWRASWVSFSSRGVREPLLF